MLQLLTLFPCFLAIFAHEVYFRHMRYGTISTFQTGIAVPVFSLRSRNSVGIGEFLDLIPFGAFASKVGFDLIQLLPVNDTGEESSPYSARSAFALNPAYIRVQEVEGSGAFIADIQKAKALFDKSESIPFHEVIRFKRAMLRKIFESRKADLKKETDLKNWIEENPWVKPYAAYCLLKVKNNEASWRSWKENQDPKPSTIKTLWTKNADDALFEAWLQFIAEQQFCTAIASLDSINIKLKGDVPILINEDSADVWYERKYFDLSNRAGAPPDMFSYSGQNWGFPTYQWDALEKDDFSWWRKRLSQAAKYYHAYRIDHVLGFFRIWTIPDREVTGILGHFKPAHPITKKRLAINGISDGTLQYLTSPNFGRDYLKELFATDLERVLSVYFDSLGNSRFKIKDRFLSEQSITGLPEAQNIKDALLKAYWNRVFLPNEDHQNYWPFWYWYNAPVLFTLPEHEQRIIRNIMEENEHSQEQLWQDNGMKLLQVMAEETDMLVCAEDLGVIPDCVPNVLHELGILSLRIERWTRKWKEEGQPYFTPKEYPRLSVCTTSCHDSSTLAGLWQEPDFDAEAYWKHLGETGAAPQKVTAPVAKKVLQHLFSGNSLLAIPSLQDYLSLSPKFADRDPEKDRINIPGTVGHHNWAWRMPVLAEDLTDDSALLSSIKGLVEERRMRQLWE